MADQNQTNGTGVTLDQLSQIFGGQSNIPPGVLGEWKAGFGGNQSQFGTPQEVQASNLGQLIQTAATTQGSATGSGAGQIDPQSLSRIMGQLFSNQLNQAPPAPPVAAAASPSLGMGSVSQQMSDYISGISSSMAQVAQDAAKGNFDSQTPPAVPSLTPTMQSVGQQVGLSANDIAQFNLLGKTPTQVLQQFNPTAAANVPTPAQMFPTGPSSFMPIGMPPSPPIGKK